MAASTEPETYTNISGYLFARLDRLKEWRATLLDACKAHQLKGTILLSTEGINLFLAGKRDDIDHLIAVVRGIPGLERFEAKRSESDHQPFNRMLVRIKKEIISFGVPEVDPAAYTSPHLPAATLKQWLDEGRPITLLDTRNNYEVKLGTFRNALPADVDTFRQFPDAVARLPEELKQQPVVTFCTGGIRCEKAAPYLESQGFKHVYQLDGGILKYFEEVGGDHYEGECFVFDQRVGLDPSLRETPSTVCYRCQTPLEVEEQQDPRYVEGESCPYCYVHEQEKMAQRLDARHQALARVTQPLPGSIPCENLRPLHIRQDFDGWTLLDLLLRLFPQIDAEEWSQRLAEGRFQLAGGGVVDGSRIVRAGERYLQRMAIAAEPDVHADVRFLYEDDTIIVVRKPAPLPMHPCGRYHRNTLQSIINQVVLPAPRPVHRLDANTSGLVLFAKTRRICTALQRQFQQQSVGKTYLLRVQGEPAWQATRCDAAISALPGSGGSRQVDPDDGLAASTDFEVLHRFGDGTTLLQARLGSGRTNQIRVHAWHLGHPVCGDPTYLPDGQQSDRQTLDCDEPPMQLHAWQLSFDHPATGERLTFEDTRPDWAVVPA